MIVSAAGRIDSPPGLAGLIFTGRNGTAYGLHIDSALLLVVEVQIFLVQNHILLVHIHAQLGQILFIDTKGLDLRIGKGDNGSAAHKIIEQQGLLGGGIPELFRIQLIAELHSRHGSICLCLRQQAQIFPFRHGLGKQEALDINAADALEEFRLLHGLHALCDDRRSQPVCHADNGTNDNAASAADLIAQKDHIQLDDIHFDIFQHVERRIAAAEIIHFHGIAQGLQPGHEPDQKIATADHGALGDLHTQISHRDAIGFPDTLHAFYKIAGIDIVPGHVKGNRHVGDTRFPALPEKPARLFHDVEIQLGDETAVLENRDKLAGRLDAELGMDPPHQRLCADDAAVEIVILGLIIYLKLMVCKRLFRIFQNLDLIHKVLVRSCFHGNVTSSPKLSLQSLL